MNATRLIGVPGYISGVTLFLVFTAATTSAHGGLLDAFGRHHNRTAGGHHSNQNRLASDAFGPKAEMPRRAEAQQSESAPPPARQRQASRARTVTHVVDGDTLVLDGGERVRLIGVDTPETKHPEKPVEYFGKEASAFTRRMLEGKRVRLDYDQANAHVHHKDRYGRTLAYVFLEDGTFINAEIIKRGYGDTYTRLPFRYLDKFRRYEQEARKARRGLWCYP